MNGEIATIVKSKLLPVLPFITKFGGLVSTIVITDKDEADNTITKKFPVAYDSNAADCLARNSYREFVPDGENHAAIAYFESQGLSYLGSAQNKNNWQSRLRFVCWYNREKITGITFDSAVQTKLLNIISGALLHKFFNAAPFVHLKVNFTGILRDPSIFSQYTYNETDLQYLMAPYDYFAIDMAINFGLPVTCVSPLELNPAVIC